MSHHTGSFGNSDDSENDARWMFEPPVNQSHTQSHATPAYPGEKQQEGSFWDMYKEESYESEQQDLPSRAENKDTVDTPEFSSFSDYRVDEEKTTGPGPVPFQQPQFNQALFAQPEFNQSPVNQGSMVPGTGPYMAFPQQYQSDKNRLTALLLGFFLGGLGIHNFYLGYTQRGVAQLLLTIGGTVTAVIGIGLIMLAVVGIWVFVDIIRVIADSGYRDGNGYQLPKF